MPALTKAYFRTENKERAGLMANPLPLYRHLLVVLVVAATHA